MIQASPILCGPGEWSQGTVASTGSPEVSPGLNMLSKCMSDQQASVNHFREGNALSRSAPRRSVFKVDYPWVLWV